MKRTFQPKKRQRKEVHGCILRKNLSPVWGLMWSQIGDRLAIQQYIA